jgi:hypothetical protein
VIVYRNNIPFGSGAIGGLSKLDGAGAVNANVRISSGPASGVNPQELLLLQNATSVIRKLEEPIILVASQGLCLECQNPNIAIYGSFEWIEEDV